MLMKTCKVCKKDKPIEDFYTDKKRCVCKKCKNEKTIIPSRNYRLRLKEEVLRHYSPDLKCACKKCPYPYPGIEFLSLDHIDGKGEHGRSIRRVLYQWVKNNKFPKGFQVMCYNCNLAKREHSECPHNTR
jgi:hypothetical protein